MSSKVSFIIIGTVVVIFAIAIIVVSIDSEIHRVGVREGSYNIEEITFKGHKYIIVEGGGSRGNGLGIVHSPDCPCKDSLKTNSK